MHNLPGCVTDNRGFSTMETLNLRSAAVFRVTEKLKPHKMTAKSLSTLYLIIVSRVGINGPKVGCVTENCGFGGDQCSGKNGCRLF